MFQPINQLHQSQAPHLNITVVDGDLPQMAQI
jgi:hypothetical protein